MDDKHSQSHLNTQLHNSRTGKAEYPAARRHPDLSAPVTQDRNNISKTGYHKTSDFHTS